MRTLSLATLGSNSLFVRDKFCLVSNAVHCHLGIHVVQHLLSYLILSYLILSYFILSYLILSMHLYISLYLSIYLFIYLFIH